MRLSPYLKTKDYFYSQEEFKLLYDEELDMLVTHPQPENLHDYYKSENYISHSDSKTKLLDKLYHYVKQYSIRKKIALIGSFNLDNKTILDVGAGTGDFLVQAQKNGWSVTGVEPNKTAALKAKEKGLKLYANISELHEEKFDVITLWHVLEHLPDLDNQISKIVSLLSDSGVLIIAVPNFKSYDAKKYAAYWAAFDVPRHLWHFSKTAVKQKFEKHFLTVFDTKPMLFDSYYVSILSEKYKTGRHNFFKAFYIGFLSNWKAKKSKEYSSHIYLIKNA